MKIVEYFSVNNDCYKNNVKKLDSRYINFQNNGPQGLMLHSVGCNQDDAKVFANNWNKVGYTKEVAVHAVLQADGTVYQCLPWNFRGWHAGGSANNTHIGVEMTEPDCIKYTSGSKFTCSDLAKARAQVKGTYETAVELFADLCKKYNLDPMKDGVIISHAEGHKRGVASNHGDPSHLWKGLGLSYTMDGFRKDVKAAMAPKAVVKYRVRKAWADTKSQIGAYSNLDNAKVACDKAGAGYYVFDESGKAIYPVVSAPVVSTPSVSTSFKKGDEVKLVEGAKYASGKSIKDWVFKSKLYVREIKDNGNIVVSTLKIGPVTGTVSSKYLVPYVATPKFKAYKVKITTDVLRVRDGAGTSYKINTTVKKGQVFTITEEKNGFGKLKSGAGWISLEYTQKV